MFGSLNCLSFLPYKVEMRSHPKSLSLASQAVATAVIVCLSSQAFGQGATWRQNALKACKSERCRSEVENHYEESVSKGLKFVDCVETFSLAAALTNNEAAQSVVAAGVAACGGDLNEFQDAVRSMIAGDPRYSKVPQAEVEKLQQQWTKYIINNANSRILPAILVLRANQNQNRPGGPGGTPQPE
jgi:hypothetical protein